MLQRNLSGQTFGHYQIIERIGQGGMGAVYLGYHAMLDRKVAIKAMLASLSDDSDYVKRFVREARTSAALEHPYIVPIHDFGVQDDIAYVVMRLLTGGTLSERLESARSKDMALPSVQETLEILRHLSSALDYAHGQGVIHRDLKASNVMFDDKGTPFIVDFGLAKLVNAQSILTNTGVAMGTPTYMPPEQWRSEMVTPAADQYALAVLTYIMLTGVPPFDADNPFTMMQMHTEQAVPDVTLTRADLPEALNAVLRKGMAKVPDERYGSTMVFADAFADAITTTPRSEPTGFFDIAIQSAAAGSLASLTPTHDTEGPTLTPTPVIMQRTPVVQPVSATLPAKQRSQASRRGLGVLLVLSFVMGAVLLVVLSQNNTDDNGTSTPVAIVAEATSVDNEALAADVTDVVTVVPTDAPTDAPSFTPTAQPRDTATVQPTVTPIRAETRRADTRATADVIQTQSALNVMLAQSAQETLDAIDVQNTATRQAIQRSNANATATATVWTKTPSPTWTPSNTPTATHTPSATATPTASDTPIPSATPTATPLPTDTATPTQTATVTSTASPTARATATQVATTDITAVARAIEVEQTATQIAIFADLINTCQPDLLALEDVIDTSCRGAQTNQVCAGDFNHLNDSSRFVADMPQWNTDGEAVHVQLEAVSVDETTPPNMEVLVYGGYHLTQQASESSWWATVVGNTSARVRNGADGNQVVAGLTANTAVRLIGRNQAGDWLRLIYTEDDELRIGWVASFLINSEPDVMQLPIVIENNAPYLFADVWELERTPSACSNAPFGGVLLRNRRTSSYPIIINGVQLRVGRGAYVHLDAEDNLVVYAINDQTTLQRGDELVTLAPGTRLLVPVDATVSLLDASLQAYDDAVLATLPLNAMRVTTTLSSSASSDQLLAAQALQTSCRIIGTTLVQPLSGPGADYAIRDTLVLGELYEAKFVSLVDGAFWYQLTNDSWVLAEDVATQGDCDVVPATLNLPPTPTITPTPVPITRYQSLHSGCGLSYPDARVGDVFTLGMSSPNNPFATRAEAQADFDAAGGGTVLVDGVPIPSNSGGVQTESDGWLAANFNFRWVATQGTHTITYIWIGQVLSTCTIDVLPR